jgi:hypothetical protein
MHPPLRFPLRRAECASLQGSNIRESFSKMNQMKISGSDSDGFCFLNKTIAILLVDNAPGGMAQLNRELSVFEMFDVMAVQTALEAAEILSTKRVHLCISELTVDDINNDPYFLPKTFSPITRFIAVSGKQSCSEGSRAACSGFVEVYDKPFKGQTMRSAIFRNAIINILAPSPLSSSSEAFFRSLSVLMDASPDKVEAWAHAIGIATCTLRELWDKRGIAPKEAIFIWHLYKAAFSYYMEIDEQTLQACYRKSHGIEKIRNKYFCKRNMWNGIVNQLTCPVPAMHIVSHK